MFSWARQQKGFTIVELLIVVVVIAILAAITVVAYNGIQNQANNTRVINDIRQVATLIEAYNAKNGSYPSTGSLAQVYTDANCHLTTDSDGYKGDQWVPGVTSALPQNPGLENAGRGSFGGCYSYSSDGEWYVLSAWNAKRGSVSSDDTMYRRLGWRESNFFSANSYNCNHPNIGGTSTGSYVQTSDYYKYSYTISNINSCNETPPSGA